MGRGVLLPSRLESLGEHRKLLHWGPGLRGRKPVLVHSELETTHVVTTNLVLLTFLFCDTQKCRLHISLSLQAPPLEPVVGLLEGEYIAYGIPHIFQGGCIPPIPQGSTPMPG